MNPPSSRVDKPTASIEDVGRVRTACALARVCIPDALNAFKRILQVLEEVDALPGLDVRAVKCGYMGCVKAYGHLGPCSLSNLPHDQCQCGHDRTDHIYHEGACRPGFVCPARCQEFRPAVDPT